MLIRFKELSPSCKVRAHVRGNPFYEVTATSFSVQRTAECVSEFSAVTIYVHRRSSPFGIARGFLFLLPATVRICIKGVTWDAACRSSNALHFACSRSAHECKTRARVSVQRRAHRRVYATRSGQDRCEPRGRLVKCTVESHPTAASYSTRCTHTRVCTLI